MRVVSLVLGMHLLAAPVVGAESAPVDYTREVLPLLQARCLACHAGADASSGYRLDERREVLGETTGHPLALPGKARESALLRRVLSTNPKRRMPPEGAPLTEAEVDLLRRWIDGGLAWAVAEPRKDARHWAFQPLSPTAPPLTPDAAGNAIDAFLAVKWRKHGLAPSPQAPRRVLIRRLSLDLLGLPPTPEEVDAFVADAAPDAYERLVERLLSSPHHGERWGRHWLDVARWAESEGYESNHPRPSAWRYRDYVTRAFNEDRPFDRFAREQLAGDELTPLADEHLVATGFLAAARLSSNEEDRWLQRNQVLVDVVNATGSAFLGLSIGCAQCHSHKFDPISLKDYYRLMAYFLPGQPVNVVLTDPAARADHERRGSAEYESLVRKREELLTAARQTFRADALKVLPPDLRRAVELPREKRSVAEELLARQAEMKLVATQAEAEKRVATADRPAFDAVKKRLADLEKTAVPMQAWAYYAPGHSPHQLSVLPSVGFYPLPYDPVHLTNARCYIHLRGEVHGIGPVVAPGTPEVFPAPSPTPDVRPGSRLELARWLTGSVAPLTARVWANRVWQYHFGRGLVATSGDFGTRGEEPSHPELLDWLAGELIRSGWSTKHLHRLIVRSAAYRQSSQADTARRQADPDNRLLTRWPIRRLEAEAIRDVLLSLTGELDPRLGGPSEPAEQTERSARRGTYLFQRRGRPAEVQGLFDGPSEAAESCPRRHASTTALQSLYLLNHGFVLARARRLASELPPGRGERERRTQVVAAFRRVLGRAPEAREVAAALRYFAGETEGEANQAEDEGLVRFSHAMLNLSEMVYLE